MRLNMAQMSAQFYCWKHRGHLKLSDDRNTCCEIWAIISPQQIEYFVMCFWKHDVIQEIANMNITLRYYNLSDKDTGKPTQTK